MLLLQLNLYQILTCIKFNSNKCWFLFCFLSRIYSSPNCHRSSPISVPYVISFRVSSFKCSLNFDRYACAKIYSLLSLKYLDSHPNSRYTLWYQRNEVILYQLLADGCYIFSNIPILKSNEFFLYRILSFAIF